MSPKKENTTIATTRERSVIPPHVRGCFWDYDPDALTWEDHADFIIARVLSSGSWDAIQWLRSCAGDQAIAGWLRKSKGGGLSGPRLRFWEVILELPHRTVSGWMRAARRSVWEGRSAA